MAREQPTLFPLTDGPTAEELVERWYPLARGLALKWGMVYRNLADDFESDAALALLKIAKSHGGDGNVKFPGLVRSACRFAFLVRLRNERRRYSIYARLGPDPESPHSLDDVAAAGSDPSAAVDLADLLDQLDPDRRERVERHYLAGETPTEIAATQGVTANKVGESIEDSLPLLFAAAEPMSRRTRTNRRRRDVSHAA